MYSYKDATFLFGVKWRISRIFCNQLLQVVIICTINYEIIRLSLYLKVFVTHFALRKPGVPLFKALEVLLDFARITSEKYLSS